MVGDPWCKPLHPELLQGSVSKSSLAMANPSDIEFEANHATLVMGPSSDEETPREPPIDETPQEGEETKARVEVERWGDVAKQLEDTQVENMTDPEQVEQSVMSVGDKYRVTLTNPSCVKDWIRPVASPTSYEKKGATLVPCEKHLKIQDVDLDIKVWVKRSDYKNNNGDTVTLKKAEWGREPG